MNFGPFRVSRDVGRVGLDPFYISPDPPSLKRDAPCLNGGLAHVTPDEDLHQA